MLRLSGRFEFTLSEIADVMTVGKRGIEKRAEREAWPYTESPVRGGRQRLYPLERLPEEVALAIIARQRRELERESAARVAADTALQARIEAQAEAFLYAKGWRKTMAEQRQDALFEVERVKREEGVSLTEARRRVSERIAAEGLPCSIDSLKRWSRALRGIPRHHWLKFLLPDAKEGRPRSPIHPGARAAFRRDFMRPEKPDAASCYRRVERLAQAHPDWQPLPSLDTFLRDVRRDIPVPQLVLGRDGEEAMMRLGPKVRRSRSDLSALEIVNADGHTFDVAVQFPDGTTGRPVILGWQDVYSGKLLAYRLARSETADVVRLSFCDMVERFGIPRRAHLDNGRAFASKTNTGGVPTRYRYKVKKGDQLGVITRLGVEVRWVKPYNGKAKPIERAWRDLASDVAKRPEFAGAYLGNSPTNKPENYGSRAVPWDEFVRVVADGVAEYNARTGRRSDVADGRSFNQVFAESYAVATIKKATREQLAMLLLASDVRAVSSYDGFVTLAGNRYWSEALCEHAGQRVELRFDPSALHAGVHAFTLDGAYIGKADCTAAFGWNTTEEMREAQRREAEYRKKHKALRKAEEERNAYAPSELPPIPEPDLPASAAVALFHPARKTAAVADTDAPEDQGAAERAAFWTQKAKARSAL